MDQASKVHAGGETCIAHFESVAYGDKRDVRKQLRNATLLNALFEQKIRGYMILLSPKRPGHGLRPPAESDQGDLKLGIDFRLVRTWTLDPKIVFTASRTHLLSWVGAVNWTVADLIEAERRIARIEDRDLRERLRAELVSFRGFRFNRDELLKLFGEARMLIPREAWRTREGPRTRRADRPRRVDPGFVST